MKRSVFGKQLRNESVFETKAKLFLFLKRKDFNLQRKVKVRKHLRNESVFETKVNLF